MGSRLLKINSIPKRDSQFKERPLTILAETGPKDHWTNNWAVIGKNLELKKGEIIHLQCNDPQGKLNNLNGHFKVAKREIVTEIISKVSGEHVRDVVRFLLLEKVLPPKGKKKKDVERVGSFKDFYDVGF